MKLKMRRLVAMEEPVMPRTTTRRLNSNAFWAVWARPWLAHRLKKRGSARSARERTTSRTSGS
jgi:hypothetical protein